MSKFIGIEDLVANALIELIEKNGNKEVSFEQLNNYGAVVVRILQSNNAEEAILLVSKYYTNELIRNYSEFFEIIDKDVDSFIKLKEGKSSDDLRNRFRAYMSTDMLVAFTDVLSLIELGVSA